MPSRARIPDAAEAARDGVPDDVHVRFLVAALLFGIVGGFTLAVALPVQAALGGMDLGWLRHAQVHGHLQAVGFAGLFIVGVGYKLAPRFGGGRIAFPVLIAPVFVLLVAGLLLRTLGQPLAMHPPFAAAMGGGAVLEAAGAALFALTVLATLAPALRAAHPHAFLMAAGALWLVAQGVLGAWWIGALAIEGETLVRSDRNAVLLTAQLFGFALSTFAGVGLRTFPSFFGMPLPSRRLGLLAAALLQGGLLLWVGAGLATAQGADTGALAAAGQSVAGLGVLTLIACFGWWRRETRLAVASQPLAWALRGALLSLTLTGLLLLGTGAEAAVRGGAVSYATADAVRHVFALGVVTLGIVGMAQLILPEFASERITRRPGRWRGLAFALPLLAAVTLRGLLPLAGLSGEARYWAMAMAGLLALGALTAFALLYGRALRGHRAYLGRIAAWRARPVEVVDRP